jgi:hypothetical protein
VHNINPKALKKVFAINSMALTFSEWVARFATVVIVAVFISFTPETYCYGQPSFELTLIYAAIMIGIGTTTDIIGAYIQEQILGFDLVSGATAFRKLKLGWRALTYFLSMIIAVPGALLFIEGGFFGPNPCFAEGRIQY